MGGSGVTLDLSKHARILIEHKLVQRVALLVSSLGEDFDLVGLGVELHVDGGH